MLNLIFGRSYAGKTEYVRQLVADKVKTGEDSCILIVPEQFSYDTEKGMLEKTGAAGMQSIEVLSLTRLAQLILEETGNKSDKQTVDKGVRMLTMSMALESLSDRLEIFGKYSSRPELTESIVSLATELKQYSVSVESLADFVLHSEESSLTKKLSELATIITLYNTMLEKSYYDSDDSLTRLAEILCEYPYFEGKTVVIDGFTRFTKQELGVVEKIITQSAEVYITFETDAGENADNFTQFENINHQAQLIRKIAEDNFVEVNDPVMLAADNTSVDPQLLRLEQNIYSCRRNPDTLTVPDSIVIYGADNKADECDFVAMSIKKLMRERSVRCRDIIVWQRDKGAYDSELVSAFKRYEVPFFEDRRQPVQTQPLMVYVSSLLELLCNSISTQSLMRWLKTGLTPLSDDEISQLENYAFTWNITAKGWKNDFTENPRGFGVELNDYDRKTLVRLNRYRAKAVAPLLDFKKRFTEADGSEKAEALYGFIKENGVDEKLRQLSARLSASGDSMLTDEQNAVWGLLMSMLDKLYLAVRDTQISNKRFYELFNLLMDVSDLGTLPQGLDDVTLALADRTRTGIRKYAFVIGMNDGAFPKTPSSEGLLNDTDRSILKQAGIELAETARYKGTEEQYIAYRALCSASDGLYITFSSSDYTGNALSASEAVGEVRAVFPKIKTLTSSDLSPIDRIESRASAFKEFAVSYSSKDKLSASLGKLFRDDPLYSGRVETLVNAASKREKVIEDKALAEELFGRELYMSSTRIDCYSGCPFKYFCRYGLDARPRKEAKIDNLLSGTVVHKVFEDMLKKYSKQELLELSDDALKKDIRKAIDEYMDENMGGAENRSKRFLMAFDNIATELFTVFKRIIEEFSFCEFEPVEFELKIGMGSDIKPYEVILDDGGVIKINGSVDRVDKLVTEDESYVRIIDYKSNGKTFSMGEVLNGFNIQMLIYLFALMKNGREKLKLDSFVPAGVLYMPANNPSADLGRDADEDAVNKKKLYEKTMTGVVIDELPALEGMERDLKGYFIPARVEKNTLKGNYISRKTFMKLREIVDSTLKRIGEELHSGRIAVYPTSDACKYCDYKSVCGFEEGDSTNDKANLTNVQALEYLHGEEVESDGV